MMIFCRPLSSPVTLRLFTSNCLVVGYKKNKSFAKYVALFKAKTTFVIDSKRGNFVIVGRQQPLVTSTNEASITFTCQKQLFVSVGVWRREFCPDLRGVVSFISSYETVSAF